MTLKYSLLICRGGIKYYHCPFSDPSGPEPFSP